MSHDVKVETVLTAHEFKDLQAWAEAAGKPISEMVRRFVRKGIYPTGGGGEETG